MTTSQPWDRIEDPPQIPSPCDPVTVRLLTASEFELLLRANLVPGKDRVGFHQLWQSVAFNDDLAEQAFDVLEDWMDLAEAEVAREPVSPRPGKFRERCDEAWNRLTRIRDLDSRTPHTPGPGSVAYALAAAVARHREAVGEDAARPVDRALWASLTQARDRARRGDNSKDWATAPTYTSQLVSALKAHRRVLGKTGRAVDEQLWGVLRD